MRLRKLTASAAAVLAAAALTACESKAGAAAVVDGHRISDSEVNSYVRPGGAPSTAADQSGQSGQKPLPKTTVVSSLVQAEVFRRTLAANGGVPSPSDLTALHDRAAQTILQTQLTGADLDAALEKSAETVGLAKKFVPVYLTSLELEQALIERVRAQAPADLAKAIEKAGVDVSVSKRYGTWDPAQFAVSDPTAGVPEFLKLGSASSAPAPAPAG